MSSLLPVDAIAVQQPQPRFWLQRSVRTIFFFVVALTVAGIYVAFRVPISVFPDTNFPRVVIGVDNGVMPVEQMQVTVTKPIEDAVNSVPGLMTVRSNTSRGSAEVSLFFDWSQDMFRTLQLVDAALSKVRQTLPATATITTNRLTFATFPILGYSLTSDTVSQTQLWEIATYDLKPPLNRVAGVSTVTVQGGKIPEFHVVPNMARLQTSGVTVLDLSNAIQNSNIIDSPGLYEPVTKTIWAFNGRSSDATVIDTAQNKAIGTVKLPGKPEFPVADGKGTIFVNIETKNSIVRINAKSMAITAEWPLTGCDSPSGLAFDAGHRRLFSVCDGKAMVVTNADTGKALATPAIGDSPDATAYDAKHQLAFSSNGDGTLTVIDVSGSTYKVLQNLPTQKGARTMAFDPTTGRMYLSTAKMNPPAAPTPQTPKPRATAVPGSFTILVVDRN